MNNSNPSKFGSVSFLVALFIIGFVAAVALYCQMLAGQKPVVTTEAPVSSPSLSEQQKLTILKDLSSTTQVQPMSEKQKLDILKSLHS